MARPTGTTRAKKPILQKEFQRLIRAVNYNTRIKSVTKVKLIAAFTLLYLTGCRISEIVKMSNEDILYMIQENEYSLTNVNKMKTPRLISFDDGGAQVKFLQQIIPKNKKFLFNRNNSDEPMTAGAFTKLLNDFIHSMLGELYSSHSFRAGYVTAFHQMGFSLEHIRQDIGHKAIATTARYATVTSDEISKGKNMRQW